MQYWIIQIDVENHSLVEVSYKHNIDFYFEERSSPESLATRPCYDVSTSAEVHFVTFPHG